MKINPFNTIQGFLERIGDRKDSGSDGQSPGAYTGNGKQGQKNPQEQSKQEEAPVIEVTSEKVIQAVEAFQKDAQTQSNGLNASVTGQGPGLRVVLTDGNGSVIRQFTGEEFLKLRQGLGKDGRSRGKILDQKL